MHSIVFGGEKIMKSRFNKFCLPILILFLLINGCTNNQSVNSTNDELVKVKVYISPYLSFGPYFIAEDEGYFREQGIEIEPVQLSDYSQQMCQTLFQLRKLM